jgi:hypothetical protein
MNKEEVYDEQISPLMQEVIAICKENGIGLFFTACIPTDEDPHLMCSTCIPSNAADLDKLSTDEPGDAIIEQLRQTVYSQRQSTSTPVMHMTTINPDGSKTLTAFI